METPVTIQHPETGASLHRGVRPFKVFYGEVSEVINAPGWYPDDTEDELGGVFSPADTRIIDRCFNHLKAQSEGLLTAKQVRKVRKKLRLNGKTLSQRLAGEILGGGPNAFQKYEAGDIVITRSMDGLLRLLDQSPEALLDLPRAHSQEVTA